jgi:hypothetical protein
MLRLFLLLALLVVPGTAWMTGSSVSSFGGSVLITGHNTLEQRPANIRSSDITMKKGKANVPPQMRSQYAKQQEMMAMREQMIAATKPGSDGFPVFNLFVRTKRANVGNHQLSHYSQSHACFYYCFVLIFVSLSYFAFFKIDFRLVP